MWEGQWIGGGENWWTLGGWKEVEVERKIEWSIRQFKLTLRLIFQCSRVFDVRKIVLIDDKGTKYRAGIHHGPKTTNLFCKKNSASRPCQRIYGHDKVMTAIRRPKNQSLVMDSI